MLRMAMAWSFFGGVVVRYAFPVLRMTSHKRSRCQHDVVAAATSLQRGEYAIARATSHWLRRVVPDDGKRQYRRVHYAWGAGGGVCHASLPCYRLRRQLSERRLNNVPVASKSEIVMG